MTGRQTWAEVDLGAFAHNVRALSALAAPAQLCAVVKGEAYGHGAVECARAAIGAGAAMLGVALVEEAALLRAAGIDARILLLSEPPEGSEADVARLGIEATVYNAATIERLAATGKHVAVHLKMNTGMNRVGAPMPAAASLARQIMAAPDLRLTGTWTHLAVADEPSNPETKRQVERFESVLADLEAAGIDPGARHVANTAALLVDPAAYSYDMVRCGIGLYGIAPGPEVAGPAADAGLRPVMSLLSHLTHVVRHPAGSRISYGRRYELARDAWVGTAPIGYADGVRRGLSGRASVLVRGKTYPIAGTVTMDQILVDFGDDHFAPGEEVVLLGARAGEAIRAEEWAAALGTIGYEITCGIGPRVPRRYVS